MIQVESRCPRCGAVHNPLLHRSFSERVIGLDENVLESDAGPHAGFSTFTYLCETCGETYWVELPV